MTRKKRNSLYKDGHRNAIYNTGKLEKCQKFNNAVRLSKLQCIIKMENYGTLASVGTKWIHGNAKFNKKTTKSLCVDGNLQNRNI